jgi:predicted ribosomally synthesized peptide with SipW-like signal peptide
MAKLSKTKRYLVLLAAVGLIAAGLGGTGTFATFNAETSNNGNYFATGTLLLHDFGGTNTCTSEFDNLNNTNTASPTGCDILFHIPALTPGSTYPASLTLTNAGTLNAQDIKFALGAACQDAPPTLATLTTGFNATDDITVLHLSNLGQTLVDHTQITVKVGATTETFTVLTTTAAGPTVNVPVVEVPSASQTFASGAKVILTAFGSGTLCSDLQFNIIETQGDHTTPLGCAYGTLQTGSCTFDPAITLGGIGTNQSNVVAPSNTLALASGTGNLNALDAGKSRYFVLNVKAPASLANANMNDQVLFDLHWHIDS